MASGSPSPPLIKGIDGIVSRPPNKVNYSTLNGNGAEEKKKQPRWKPAEKTRTTTMTRILVIVIVVSV